jgi:hypothetical protein
MEAWLLIGLAMCYLLAVYGLFELAQKMADRDARAERIKKQVHLEPDPWADDRPRLHALIEMTEQRRNQ